MSAVTAGKWSCPICNRTVVVYASEPDTDCCLIAAQIRHGRAHKAAARMPMPTPRRKTA